MSTKTLAISLPDFNIFTTPGKGEQNLHQFIESINTSTTKFNIKIESKPLKVGDILITGRLANREEVNPCADLLFDNISSKECGKDDVLMEFCRKNVPLLLIERKELGDFCSSFKSGHLKEQNARGLEFCKGSGGVCQYMLVVEGFHDTVRKCRSGKVCGFPVATLEQAFTSIMIRDKIYVQHVADVKSHAEFILGCVKTMDKYKLVACGNDYDQVEAYSSNLKVKKKENLTPELYLQKMIGDIPMFSVDIAAKIVAVYPNLSLLLKEIGENGIKNLQEIKVGKNKLGKVKAGRLCDYLK